MPVALALAFVSGAFGHGSYVAARLALPYACAAIALNCAPLAYLLVFVQWPFYGLVLDRTKSKELMAAILAGAHVALCYWLFHGGKESF